MVVEHRDVVDVDLVGQQIDAPLQVRVVHTGLRNGKRRVGDRDRSVRMRIGGGTGDVDIRLQGALDVGHDVSEALHQAEIDRGAFDVKVDAILGGGLRAVRRRACLRRHR